MTTALTGSALYNNNKRDKRNNYKNIEDRKRFKVKNKKLRKGKATKKYLQFLRLKANEENKRLNRRRLIILVISIILGAIAAYILFSFGVNPSYFPR